MKRNNDEEDGGHQKAQRHQEEQSLADPPSQNKDFKQQTVHPPATPTTPRNRFITEFLKGGAARADSSAIRPSNISQAACSPSSNDGLPVITNVCSLSRNRTRGKRAQHASAQVTPKRPRVNGFKTTISDTHSSLDARPSFSPSVPGVDDDGDDNGDDDGDDTDDDLIILENSSTPKPKKLSFNETKVKTEQEPTDISILEHTDDAAVDADAGGRAAATSISPVPPPDLTSTTTCTMTQTEVPKVKTEQESQTGMERAEQSTSYANGNDKSTHMDMQLNIIKQEETGDTQSDMQKGIEYLKSDKDVSADACDQHYSPHQPPSFTEAQEQQDQLLELMQVTALERDSCKEQVHQLTSLLQDLQSKLQELSQMNVKECFHKASQTEETQEDDYKSLYEAAKQKVDELIKDKEALLAAAEAKHSDHEKEDTDDIKLPIDCLIQNLDQRNQENYELRSQLDSVTEEKANLEAQCEALRLSLQQQREDAQEGSTTVQTATASSAQTRGGADLSGTDSRSDAFKRLIELRRNISQLLVTYIPALDLAQMNYECDVVDELLEQVLSAKFFEVQEQWEEA